MRVKKVPKWYNEQTDMWKDFLTIFSGLLVLTGLLFLPMLPVPTQAVDIPSDPFGNHDFGGIVVDKKTCSCNFFVYGWLIKIDRPWESGPGGAISSAPGQDEWYLLVGGLTRFVPVLGGVVSSQVYEYDEVKEDRWVLGLAKGPDLACTHVTCNSSCCGTCCPRDEKGPWISIIGTSKEIRGSGLPGF